MERIKKIHIIKFLILGKETKKVNQEIKIVKVQMRIKSNKKPKK